MPPSPAEKPQSARRLLQGAWGRQSSQTTSAFPRRPQAPGLDLITQRSPALESPPRGSVFQRRCPSRAPALTDHSRHHLKRPSAVIQDRQGPGPSFRHVTSHRSGARVCAEPKGQAPTGPEQQLLFPAVHGVVWSALGLSWGRPGTVPGWWA